MNDMLTFAIAQHELYIIPKLACSKFDSELQRRWDRAMDSGVFRFDLRETHTKTIPGSLGYVALLNVKRATERRAPESMSSLNQRYDPDKFNFTKIKPTEYLFKLQSVDGDASSHDDCIIVNVSPADYCHSLIVPDFDLQLNQNLTLHGIELALRIMCLSSQRSFRIGFNSLCAHASVNHQHLHCYYTDQQLLAERLKGKELVDGLHLLNHDAPLGYGFQLSSVEQMASVARKIYKCTNYMRENEIAHTLFICRGDPFNLHPDDEEKVESETIRALLWPRTKVLGPKPSEAAFNTAVLEMAGHLLIKETSCYENMTEAEARRCLKDAAIPITEFEQLTQSLVRLIPL